MAFPSVQLALAFIAAASIGVAACTSRDLHASQRNGPHYDRILATAVQRGVPGIQAHVTHGATEWSGVAGLAYVESAEVMTPAHRVRTASITKMLTYAAVMELVRTGRLSLTDRAVHRMPPGTLDGIPHANDITIAHLLDHTSGLHNYNGENGAEFFAQLFADSARGSRAWDPKRLLAFARNPAHPPTARPGERRAYSSTGYSVLELIIQHAERTKTYAQVLRERVFMPLGMTHSCVEGTDCHASDIAPSYARPGERSGPTPFERRSAARRDGLVNLSAGLRNYNAWAGAGGAVASTASDLARFMAAVRAGRITVLRDQAGELARVAARPNGTLAWHGGTWGVSASIIYDPGRDITVIVLTNASNAGPSSADVARQLLDVARRQSTVKDTARGQPDVIDVFTQLKPNLAPDVQLRRFLEISIATRQFNAAQFSAVYACRDREDYMEGRWVADFHVLGVDISSDSTVEGTAILTSVARAKESATGYVAEVGVREDTAR
ncbi:MAG TPA: serine hydrolase domain-containing protein [Gemmatimonadaceae bacterium]|nr:serine hydrolase domain-containing protein [Gemmatimonadaceae bacterium]